MCVCVLVPGEALKQLRNSQGAQGNGGGVRVLVLSFIKRGEKSSLDRLQTHKKKHTAPNCCGSQKLSCVCVCVYLCVSRSRRE